MLKPANIFLGLLLVFITASESFSQGKPGLTISSNKEKILLGEQFELSVELKIPVQSNFNRWPLVPDTGQHLEVISRSVIDSSVIGNFRSYRQTIIMTGFDSGRWKLPVLNYQLGKDVLQSNSLQIDVLTQPLKGSDYNDIHEIIEVQKPLFQWWKFWAIVTALALSIMIYLFFRHKKVKTLTKGNDLSKMGSFEYAVEQMNLLKSDKLIEKGEMKKYYIRLYDILRVYISVKYTDDMVMKLLSVLDKETASKGIQCLRVCEAVKFAKYGSSPSEADHAWREIYHVLELLNSKNMLK